MRSILREYIRVADRVVKLDQDSASSYTREHGCTLRRHAVFPLGPLVPVDVVRLAVATLGGHSTVDVLIDNRFSAVDVSRKKFGSGWSITKTDDLIEVCVNGLFSLHAFTLRIDSTVVIEAAHLARHSGLRKGRIFYVYPSRSFRYSVFCPLGDVHTAQDILDQTQVGFSVEIPSFIDDKTTASAHLAHATPTRQVSVTYARGTPANLSALQADTAPRDDKGNYAVSTTTLSVTRAQDAISVTRATELPVPGYNREAEDVVAIRDIARSDDTEARQITTPVPVQPFVPPVAILPEAKEARPVAGKFFNESNDVRSDQIDDVPGNPLIASPPVTNSLAGEPSAEDGSFDINLFVMLDEKVDTAMAAAAFLARQTSQTAGIVEVGLWRRRLRSVLGRFATISDVFELTTLPWSTANLMDFSTFIDGLDRGTSDSRPVMVIGEELLDPDASRDFCDALSSVFPRMRLIIFGQGNASLSAHWSILSDLVERACECHVLLGDEIIDGLGSMMGKRARMSRYYLPRYLKHKLLDAEKKGNVSQRVQDFAEQILPD
jgi:hypothetical protein